MNPLKKLLVILLLSPAIVGCNQKKVDELTAENQTLSTQKQELNTELEAYMKTFNEIEANLKEIKEREETIGVNSSGVEGKKGATRESLVRDIEAINALMAENKEKMKSLQAQANSSNEFKTMVANLNRRVKEKDAELAELKQNLEQLTSEKQELTKNVESLNYTVDTLSNARMTQSELIAEQKQRLENQLNELNTGYVAIGSFKDLKDDNVLVKEGGLLGIGRTEKLKNDFNKEAFNKIDITQVNSIPLSAKKVEMVTVHPEGSYEFNKNDDNEVEQLVILDPEQFWNSSKYLVLVTN